MAGIVRTRQTLQNQAAETAESSWTGNIPREGVRERRARRNARKSESISSGTTRREQHGTERKHRQVKTYDQPKRSLPPIMVRGAIQGDMAVPASGSRRIGHNHPSAEGYRAGRSTSASLRGRPRRRWDLTLNVPGAELRLPSVPALHISWRLASGLLTLLMAACLYFLFYSPAFQVDVVQVEGLQRLSLEDIYPKLTITGKPLVMLDSASVEQELSQAFPEFSSIQVKVYFPKKIKLIVTERVPLIAWVQKDVENWIDQEGVGFPARGQPGKLVRIEADGVPLATSTSSQPEEIRLPAQMVSTILAMGAYLPEGASILYTQDRGFGWLDPRGWNVFFGRDLDQITQKLEVYKTLSESLVNQGVQPTLISMEYLNAPYYRR